MISLQCQNFDHEVNIFGPRPLKVKSLKEAWVQQSLINNQNFDIDSHLTFSVEIFT